MLVIPGTVLKRVRVPSDQNTRWRLSFHFLTDKKQEFLVSLYFSISRYLDESEIFVATPHTRDRDDAENAKNDANISKNIFFRFSLIFAIFGFFKKNIKNMGQKLVATGVSNQIFTDHKSLKHLMSQKELNMRQRRLI